MELKIKKIHDGRIIRFKSIGEIKEVFINSDIMNGNKDTISVCFRGEKDSGIIEMKTEEINHIYNIIKKEKSLIKGMKVIKGKL